MTFQDEAKPVKKSACLWPIGFPSLTSVIGALMCELGWKPEGKSLGVSLPGTERMEHEARVGWGNKQKVLNTAVILSWGV